MAPLYKLTVIAAISVFFGIWIGESLSSDTETHIASSDQSNTPRTSDMAENSVDIVHLQQKIRQLQAENHQLKAQIQKPYSNPSITESLAKETTEIDLTVEKMLSRLQTLEMEKQERKATDVINWIVDSQNADRNFDLNDELSRRFEQEIRDPVWAEQQEDHYRQLFSEQRELQDIALRDTRCHNSQCEITIGISNLEQSNLLFNTINQTLAKNGKNMEVMITTDENLGVSKLYITNNEKTFAFDR